MKQTVNPKTKKNNNKKKLQNKTTQTKKSTQEIMKKTRTLRTKIATKRKNSSRKKINKKHKHTKQQNTTKNIHQPKDTKKKAKQKQHISFFFFAVFFPSSYMISCLYGVCAVFFVGFECKENRKLQIQIKHVKILHTFINTTGSRNNTVLPAIQKRFLKF